MQTVIEVTDLRKKYEEVDALKGIDLTVNEGEIFALLGPNGAGKTTLFSILATLRKPTAGRAMVLGNNVLDHQEEIRQQIGIVFQQPALDDRLSARDNLMLMALFYGISRKKAGPRADEVLKMLEIGDLSDRPASFPADKNASWSWRGQSSPVPGYCFWTKPRSAWMWIRGAIFGTRCANFLMAAALSF